MFESVTFRYLELGDTFNPCDQAGGVAERAISKRKTLEMPEDMYKVIESSRKSPHPFQVIRLNALDFRKWKEWAADRFAVLGRIDSEGNRSMFSNMRQW